MQELFDEKRETFVEWLKYQWDINFDCIRRDIDIQGSPERTIARIIFQEKDSTLLLLEQFPESKFRVRHTVARAIEYLNQKGLTQALLYKKSNSGEFLPFFEGSCFQVSQFLDSTGIKRPDYLSSATIGGNFASFLVRLSKASEGMENSILLESFSIKKYIYKLFSEMKIYDYKVYKRYLPFLTFLEKEFMSIHDKLPVSFCHGDLHPLNAIWDNDRIKAVIDWEFTGIKPDIYDAANLVGCAGIENPEGFGMPMVMTFLQQIRQQKLFSEMGWRFFPEYLLALRFAWLSEWLRQKDKEMIEMEEAYMELLVDNMDILRQGWELKH